MTAAQRVYRSYVLQGREVSPEVLSAALELALHALDEPMLPDDPGPLLGELIETAHTAYVDETAEAGR